MINVINLFRSSQKKGTVNNDISDQDGIKSRKRQRNHSAEEGEEEEENESELQNEEGSEAELEEVGRSAKTFDITTKFQCSTPFWSPFDSLFPSPIDDNHQGKPTIIHEYLSRNAN